MKSAHIKQLLIDLQDELGLTSFDVVDYWEADLTAIGIGCRLDRSRLVYVDAATSPRFTAMLEVAPEAGSELLYTVVGTHDELNLAQLAQVIRSHLRIENIVNSSR
jgi:hypothetical protein